ncbi:MAG: hypothetical protein ABR519_01785 [Bacteroidales bacterium]
MSFSGGNIILTGPSGMVSAVAPEKAPAGKITHVFKPEVPVNTINAPGVDY